jgi:uncharacterized caspase-like protein
MSTFCRAFLAALVACWLGSSPASAEKRVALVIGNGAYAHAPQLPNPARDAEDVAAALTRSGFDVISASDLGQADMQENEIRFARAANNADIAVFYYSGHAMQFNGVNYLMPIDAKLDDEADLKRFLRVDDILGDLQQARNLRILVLDSCRDNPLAENLRRTVTKTRGVSIPSGLSKMEAPLGTIISFSTQAGQTADDGKGRNSPYTAAFLKHIEERQEIGEVFREISTDVYDVSGKIQLPELSLSIVGKFYLNGPVSVTLNPSAPAVPADPCAAAEAHWKAADAIGTSAAYEDHLAKFPACAFANLAKARIEQLRSKMALSTPSEASAPSVTANRRAAGPEHHLHSYAAVDQTIRLRGHVNYQHHCDSVIETNITVVQAPTHGKLTTKDETVKSTDPELGRDDKCRGSSGRGKVVYYTRTSLGPDEFYYTSSSANGVVHIYVTVD